MAIEIVDGYLWKVVHGHQGFNAIPPGLAKVGSFSVAPMIAGGGLEPIRQGPSPLDDDALFLPWRAGASNRWTALRVKCRSYQAAVHQTQHYYEKRHER